MSLFDVFVVFRRQKIFAVIFMRLDFFDTMLSSVKSVSKKIFEEEILCEMCMSMSRENRISHFEFRRYGNQKLTDSLAIIDH